VLVENPTPAGDSRNNRLAFLFQEYGLTENVDYYGSKT